MLRSECARLLPYLKVVNSQTDDLLTLVKFSSVFADLLNQLAGERENQSLVEKIQGQMKTNLDLMSKIHEGLGKVDYPFDHVEGDMTIGKYVLSHDPDPENPVEIYHAAGAMVESLTQLRARLLGQVCVFAEQVEDSLGLERQPKPPEQETVAQSSL